MDKYEQEIYSFLTERTNFEAMLKVNSQFRFIKDELLRNFWDQVAILINNNANNESKKWKIINPLRKENPIEKFIVYKDLWKQNENYPFVGVAWEGLCYNPFLGVFNNIESKLINAEKLRISLDNVKNNLDFKVDNVTWWAMKQFGPYNFSVDSNLVNILPESLTESATIYSDSLLRLLNEVESIIDHVILN